MIGTACAWCGEPMELLLPGPSASNPFGTPACRPCALGALGLEDEAEGEEMSSGPGRLQRRIIELLERAENRRMSRRELEAILVGKENFDRSNVLRALKGLADRRAVYLHEGHTLDESYVSVPEPVRVFTDDQIAEILGGL